MATGTPMKTPVLLDEGISASGRRVTLQYECGSYFGARPYLTIATWDKTGQRAAQTLYSPFLRRARAIFTAMLHDVTDTAELMHAAPICRSEEALVGRGGDERAERGGGS